MTDIKDMEKGSSETDSEEGQKGLSRRDFLKASAALASATAIGAVFLEGTPAQAQTTGQNPPDLLETDADVSIIYSVCQMCHSRCGIQCKVKNGVLVKIDGNPYHPNNLDPDEMLSYATSTDDAKSVRGRLCLKGQSGIQTLYDPYRIKQPLKRVGPRGSGQWTAVTWDAALTDIAAQLMTLRDTATNLDDGATELGKKVNQILFSPGRTVEGNIFDRFWGKGVGTINSKEDHTSICETSHHVANFLITEKNKNHFKPDILAAEYTIHFGTNPLEAGFPMIALARKLMNAKRENGAKFVVIDPRLSNSAAKANQWVAPRPGTDGAIALGMARWILDNGAYDTTYLTNPNSAAAVADLEYTYTDATWLVDTSTGRYLNSAQAGLVSTTLAADAAKDAATLTVADTTGFPVSGYLRVDNEIVKYTGTTATTFTGLTRAQNVTGAKAHASGATVSMAYVCLSSGPAALADTADAGDLEVDTTVNGVAVKSAFTLYTEQVQQKTVAEYADIAGLDEATVAGLAQEFTSHGKKAVVNTYRGTVQHTNGVYSQLAVMSLNTLIGNYDWKGGNATGGGSWSETKTFDVTKLPSGKGFSATGIKLNRTSKNYEGDAASIFARDGYPAKRPWFPFGFNGNYQEVIPSAADEYPYGIRALITYWNAWPYSTPALRNVFESYVSDTTKLPLFVSISPVMGEVAALADYILPDTVYLEKWSFPGMTPTILTKATSLQQPVVGKYDGVTIGGAAGWSFDPAAANAYTPYLADTKQIVDILLGLGTKMGIDSINKFSDGTDIVNAWTWFKKQLDGLATESTKTAVEIASKGGVFEDPGNEYDGDHLKHGYGKSTEAKPIHLYIESLATTKDSMTGEYFDGVPKYEAPKHADDTAVSSDSSAYPYQLITYKSVRHGQGRTNVNPWLMMLQIENYVEINATDAAALGVETGDLVRIISPSNTAGIEGKAKITQGLRPGVVAVSHHFGHWQNSSAPFMVDGIEQGYDPTRGKGLQPTQVMRLDGALGNVSLQDKIGGSVSFSDTWINIEKVG